MRGAPIPDEPIPAVLSAGAAPGGSRLRVGDEVEVLVSARPRRCGWSDPAASPASTRAPPGWWCRSRRSGPPSATGLRGQCDLPAGAERGGPVQVAMDEVLPATQVTGRRRGARGVARRSAGAGRRRRLRARGGDRDCLRGAGDDGGARPLAAVSSRETAHLRTLGMTPRGLLGLSVIEHGPAVIVATAIGVALGVGRRVVRGARARPCGPHRLVDRRRARHRLGRWWGCCCWRWWSCWPSGSRSPAGSGAGRAWRAHAAGDRMSLRG